ncbi:unnamed protein product [Symbiodinium sp. CCMP2592]|nr:unnamed protein product [Symbiodinium sp. CCMP2592]
MAAATRQRSRAFPKKTGLSAAGGLRAAACLESALRSHAAGSGPDFQEIGEISQKPGFGAAVRALSVDVFGHGPLRTTACVEEAEATKDLPELNRSVIVATLEVTMRDAVASSDVSDPASRSIGRDVVFMERLRGLAREALAWPFLEDKQRLLWAAVLEFDAVPTQDGHDETVKLHGELPPWFFERHNFTRRHLGADLFSLDGERAILCRAGNATSQDVKRFLRTAKCLFEAPCCTLWTLFGCTVSADSQKWLRDYGGQRNVVTKKSLRQLCRDAVSSLTSGHTPTAGGHLPDPPLRPCQEACLEACAKGARVIEMACGTGKTRVICELAAKQPGKAASFSFCAQVLIIVPSRVLLEQFALEMPGLCKVGTSYNDKINMASTGFIAVTDSVHLLQKLVFEAVFFDEAHHPLPPKMPDYNKLFRFSATHKKNVDFRYSLGQAIDQGVLCDYDLTVPVTTEGHPYICLANLLLSQQGRFRHVLAYCNSVAEAKRFQQVLETVGVASWHINARTSRKVRERVMDEFSGKLQKAVHVLVTVQVLGEGVNIPTADTCMFVEPRSSYVSIIQAVGRVLRPHLSKPLAHIVLPAIVTPAAPATPGSAQVGLSDIRVATNRTEDMSPCLVTSSGPAGLSPSAGGCEDAQDVRVQESSTLRAQIMPHQGDSDGSMASGPTITDSSLRQLEQVSARSEMQSRNERFKLRRGDLAKTNGARPRRIHEGSCTDGWGESLSASRLQRYEGRRGAVSEANGGSNSRAKPQDRGSCAPAVIESLDGVEIADTSLDVCDGWLVHDSEQLEQARRSSGEPAAVFVSECASPRSSATFTRSVVHQAGPASLKLGPARSRERRQHAQLHSPPARQTSASRKLKVTTATHDMSSMVWRGNTDQLGRFLGAIAKADRRFAADDAWHLQSRFWVTDCRLQHAMMQHVSDRSVQYRLALILQQCDSWDLRLQEAEQFVLDHGRLPRETTTELDESRLAVWLQQVGVKFKKQLLPAARMQKLLNSSCGRLVARVAKWLDPETPFERCLKQLRQFVRAHHRMPKHSNTVHDENALVRKLSRLVARGQLDRERRLRLLDKEGPIVARWVMSQRTRKRSINENKWRNRLQILVEFVETHGRMPRARRAEEKAMSAWSCRQRRQLDNLPAEFQTALFDSHPVVVLLSHCLDGQKPIPPFEVGKEYLQENSAEWKDRSEKLRRLPGEIWTLPSDQAEEEICPLMVPEVEDLLQRPMDWFGQISRSVSNFGAKRSAPTSPRAKSDDERLRPTSPRSEPR